MSQAGVSSVAATSISAGQNVSTSGAPIVTISALSAVTSQGGSYTALSTDYLILCTGTFTVDLPAAVSGKQYTIKNISSGTITVDGDGAETIDGELTQTLIEDESITIMSDGSNWYIL